MFDLAAVQSALVAEGFDAWLLGDFRGSNLLAARVLGMEGKKFSRRWYYLIPAQGEPRKLVHAIEPAALDHLPGKKVAYRRWQELEAGLQSLVQGSKKLALEYSPRNGNPYISRIDGGTVELLRSFGAELHSSGDLIQLFEATLDDYQIASHLEAAVHTNSAFAMVWAFIADEIFKKGHVMERAVQARIMKHFAEHKMTTYSPPIIGVNAHSGDPHFENTDDNDTPIRKGDFVLVDLWAKMDRPRAIYSDLSRMGYVGDTVPEKYSKVFAVVTRARDAAIKKVRDAFAAKKPLLGHEVDAAARGVIEAAGYGESFPHRTGHNIGQEVHGNGAHMDGLETREDRHVLPRTCFSIEPGIYFQDYGMRSEVDVLITPTGEVQVTGGDLQFEIKCI